MHDIDRRMWLPDDLNNLWSRSQLEDDVQISSATTPQNNVMSPPPSPNLGHIPSNDGNENARLDAIERMLGSVDSKLDTIWKIVESIRPSDLPTPTHSPEKDFLNKVTLAGSPGKVLKSPILAEMYKPSHVSFSSAKIQPWNAVIHGGVERRNGYERKK